MNKESIINGAKGISLLKDSFDFAIFIFCSSMSNKLTTAPIQNAIIIAKTPPEKPKSHPTPSASFASPKPIHLPFEISQKKAKKAKSIGPASKSGEIGKLKRLFVECVINKKTRDKTMKE